MRMFEMREIHMYLQKYAIMIDFYSKYGRRSISRALRDSRVAQGYHIVMITPVRYASIDPPVENAPVAKGGEIW
jgi:hypothetical protein